MTSERRAPDERHAVARSPESSRSRRLWIAAAGSVALLGAGVAAYFVRAARNAEMTSGAPRSSATFAQERDHAVELASQSRFAEAAELFAKALEHGEDAATHAQFALTLEALGRFEDAGAQYRRALSLDPHAGSIWYDYGNLLRSRMHDYRGAIEAYRRAIDERPTLAEAHFALGAVLLDVGEPEDAAAAIESSLSLTASDASWRADAEQALLVARTRAAQRALNKSK
jgi:tetratricopeptide (TPR) repeat protein